MVDGEIDGSIYSALAIHSAVADNRLVCGSGLLVLLIQAYSGLIQCLFRLIQAYSEFIQAYSGLIEGLIEGLFRAYSGLFRGY